MRKTQKSASSLILAVFMLKITGNWYYEGKYSTLYKIYGYIALTILGIIPTSAMIAYVYTVWGDLIEMADALYFTVVMLGLTFKFVPNDNKKMRYTIELLNTEFLTKQTLEQDKYIQNSMKIAKTTSYVILGFFSLTCWSWTIASVVGGAYANKILPKSGWYYIDISKSPNFEYIYWYQSFGIWIGALMNGSLDVVIIGLVALAGGQLDVLKDSLENVRTSALRKLQLQDDICQCKNKYICNDFVHLESNIENLEEEIYKEIMDCIKHHEAISEFVYNIESTFTVGMFVHFFTTMIVICITSFQLTVIKQFTMQYMSIVMYQVSVTIQIYFYCYCGNEIFLKSSTIGDAVYMSEWYRFGPKTKRALWIIIERSKRPLSVTGLKMFVLSLDTFTSILRSAYSYFAVLRQLNAKNEINVD